MLQNSNNTLKNIQKITGFAGILFALSFMFQMPYAEAQSEFGGGSSTCMPPTLGLNRDQVSIVEGGFTINGQTHNVKYFDQDIPATSFKIGETNELILKINEDSHPSNLVHVGLDIVTQQENSKTKQISSTIEWDKNHEGKETVTTVDPNNILQDVTVDMRIDKKTHLAVLTLSFKVSVLQLEDISALQITTWDRKLCSWSNTFKFIVMNSEYLEPVYTEIEYVTTSSSTESTELENIKKVFEPIPPLEQVKSGISPNNVECKSEMILILNSNDGRPACVSNSGADKLEALEWGIRV